MKKDILHSLSLGSVIAIYDRRMNGKDTHLSVVLSVEGRTIEVIDSKESVHRNGLLSYSHMQLKNNADKRYERLKVFGAKRNRNIPADKGLLRCLMAVSYPLEITLGGSGFAKFYVANHFTA
ncbi:hypothetical protein [Moritella marina]|uniref:hypothetical protein n=1 Tax=Moritella marina TaxID=90736 RepID=UPI003703B774